MAHSASAPGSADGQRTTPFEESSATPSAVELIGQLQQDRLWLLRQLDSGRWPQWRYDLAALERELGQLLEQATDLSPEG